MVMLHFNTPKKRGKKERKESDVKILFGKVEGLVPLFAIWLSMIKCFFMLSVSII